MYNKITLKFPTGISNVASRGLAFRMCTEQVFPMLTQNKPNIIYFPSEIITATATFLDEFIYHIEKYNKDNIYIINIKAHNVRLGMKINRT